MERYAVLVLNDHCNPMITGCARFASQDLARAAKAGVMLVNDDHIEACIFDTESNGLLHDAEEYAALVAGLEEHGADAHIRRVFEAAYEYIQAASKRQSKMLADAEDFLG